MMSDGEAEGTAQAALGGGARGRCTESASRAARWARTRSMGSGVSMARDHAQRPATHRTVLDVDVEDPLEPLHPAHGESG